VSNTNHLPECTADGMSAIPKPGWPKRHDPVASAAAREHGLALNAAALARLDEDQRAMFDERAGILEYDEGLPRAEAEALALSEMRISSDDWLPVEP
jgi:hypothetical protein